MAIPTIQGIAGIITDPEQRVTGSGTAILTFRLAFNDSKFNEQTSKFENSRSFFVDTTAWDDLAKRLAGTVSKGDQVYVEGRLETQSWEKDGEKKSKPSLNIRSLRKLEKSQNAQQGGGSFQQSPQQSAPQPQQGGGWNAPAADPWSTGGNQSQGNGGGWGNPQPGNDEPPF